MSSCPSVLLISYFSTITDFLISVSSRTAFSSALAICCQRCIATKLLPSFGSELMIIIFFVLLPRKLMLILRRLMASSMEYGSTGLMPNLTVFRFSVISHFLLFSFPALLFFISCCLSTCFSPSIFPSGITVIGMTPKYFSRSSSDLMVSSIM